MANWTEAVFRGASSHLGPQQGQTYHIRLVTPGVIYSCQVLIQELPACTDEYLDATAALRDWQVVIQEGGPANA
jgi:hypothetical protein